MCFSKKNSLKSATVHINARLQPIQRGKIYEDKIEMVLKAAKVGTVDGGGTEFTKEEGQLACDIDISFYPDKKDVLIKMLQKLPFPVGSKLTFANSDEVYEIGFIEGMAVYLNGTDLDKEVYAKCDVNYVIDELRKLIGEDFMFLSYWTGNTETALYFYAKSFERMKASTATFLAEYPLCKDCRVLRIA